MARDPNQQVLRLRKKHASGRHAEPEVGARLIHAQSLSNALVGALVVIVVFAMLWSMLSVALSRVFPWLSVLLGFLVGFVVRRGGQGLDWRFPLIAALMAFVGSILGNIVVAAAYTAGNYDIGTLNVLSKVTTMTWPVFFDEVMTAADFVYAFTAAGIAAYYANRRLSRSQYHAVRKWQEHHVDEQGNKT